MFHFPPPRSIGSMNAGQSRQWLLAAAILAATLLAYQPVWHAGYIWDDDDYVTQNEALRSADGLKKIWITPGTTVQYYPLVFTSFWAERRLWGLEPFGYHLVNVILHAVNAVLLWRVLRRLQIPGAWWAATIFALHPVNVESVAWITERKNVLSGLFYLLAALAWLRFRPLTDEEPTRVPDWRYYWLASGFFVCALLSKTVTCSLPAVLLLLIWWKTGRVQKRDGVALAPWFALGIASGFMTRWMEQRLGTSRADWELSFVQRCLVAGRALWFYAGKLVCPRPLTFVYPRWNIDTGAAWQYLFPLAALLLLGALWKLRSQIGRGPLVAVLCFAGTLLPALGFVDIYPFRYSFVADHFQYLACIALIVLTVNIIAVIGRRMTNQGRHRGTVAAVVLLVILGISTWNQAHAYQDAETLWRVTLAKNPNAWLAHDNLGVILAKAGKTPEAIGHFEEAVRLKPDFTEAQYNMGLAMAQAGKNEEALGHYEQALQSRPNFAEAHFNTGIILTRLGRTTEAIGHFEEAVKLKPDFVEAHYNLGLALAKVERMPEALNHWEKAVQLKPDFAEAHYNLGLALANAGRVSEAINYWEQAVRFKSDYIEAHHNLAIALDQTGRTGEAMAEYEQALRLNPNDAEARRALARLQAQP